jgi:hypothetical protein
VIYKILTKTTDFQQQVFARIDDDGLCRVTCTAHNPEFQEAIKNGAELLDVNGQVIQDAIGFVNQLIAELKPFEDNLA